LKADLFAGHMGRQLKGRMAVYQMRTYGYGTKAQRDTWAELVLGIEAPLPLGRHIGGSLDSETDLPVGLRDTAFTEPDQILDDTVTERALCLRCTDGEPARGRVPEWGMVCIRHRRWLGSPQVDLQGYYPALVAERHFRHHLAARNFLHGSLPILIGRDCASPAIIGPDEIVHRRNQTGLQDIWALTYPEQVNIRRLLARPTFLCAATDPDVDAAQ
jgi:hypothetical protein